MNLKYEPSSEPQRVQEADVAARSSAKRVGGETRVVLKAQQAHLEGLFGMVITERKWHL